MKFFDLHFLQPIYFVLLILVPLFIWLFYKKQKNGLNFLFFNELKQSFGNSNIFFFLKQVLISLIIIVFIIIIANPNKSDKTEKITKNGIDIVISFDISSSMEANDLQPSRLASAKQIIHEFIDSQKTNRVGLVVFAGKPFTSIPLTFDYGILKETIDNTNTNTIDQRYNQLSGTAIGDAIIISETLFNEEKREKVIILITDGDANIGVDPKIAAIDSKDKGIKIYTIGIGSLEGGEISYYNGPFLQTQKIPPLNGESLAEIAKITSGEFFRATDNYSLENIFEYLEKLEKNDIEIETKKLYTTYYENYTNLLLFLILIYTLIIYWKPDL